MKAILPVAGAGSRLRPLTHTMPKALVYVAGKPILGHILDQLVPAGVDHVVLVVGQFGERIVSYVQSQYDLRVTVVEQPERLGLGHAVWLALEATPADEPVLIALGDTICDVDLAPVVGGAEAAIVLKEVADPSKYGIAEVDRGYIRRLVEKPSQPTSNLAIVGIYYLPDGAALRLALADLIARGQRVKGEYQLTDALQLLLEAGHRLRPVRAGWWLDCGSPDTLLEANRQLLDRLAQTPPPMVGAVLIPPVSIAAGAVLDQCVVGPYVSVAAGVRLERAVVRNSILNEGAEVADVLLADSIVGERAVVRGTYTRLHVGDSSHVRMVG